MEARYTDKQTDAYRNIVQFQAQFLHNTKKLVVDECFVRAVVAQKQHKVDGIIVCDGLLLLSVAFVGCGVVQAIERGVEHRCVHCMSTVMCCALQQHRLLVRQASPSVTVFNARRFA